MNFTHVGGHGIYFGAGPPPPPVLPAPAACLGAIFDAQPLELGPCVAACLRTDRSDGLFPTLVQEADGAALGLVYSSPESVSAIARPVAGAPRCSRLFSFHRSSTLRLLALNSTSPRQEGAASGVGWGAMPSGSVYFSKNGARRLCCPPAGAVPTGVL